MPTSTHVDIFDELPSADAEATNTDNSTKTAAESTESTESTEVVEVDNRIIVDVAPPGAVPVTEFAKLVTARNFGLVAADPEANAHLVGREYVVPQEVYQAVRGQRNPIPHVLVRNPDSDKAPKTFILVDEALAVWDERAKRNAERGTGGPSSTRSVDDLKELFTKALGKLYHASDRAELWAQRKDEATTLTDKYTTWLGENGVSDEDIESLRKSAWATYSAEREAKAERRKRNSDEEASE